MLFTHRRAFTLVELLVSVALTAMLLWGLCAMFIGATKFVGAVSSETELCASGRALLSKIAREIQTAVPLSAGYIALTHDGSGFDSIEVVAPVGFVHKVIPPPPAPPREHIYVYDLPAHLFYGPVESSGASRHLGRATHLDDGTAPLTAPFAFQPSDLASMGILVDQFTIEYLNAGTFTPGPVTLTAGAVMPSAIRFTVRLSDMRAGTSIALTTIATLPGAGL